MSQYMYTDASNHSLEGIEEIVINAIEADITLANASDNQVSWEADWRDAVGHPEIIREGNRLIIRFNERNIYFNFFGISIGKTRERAWKGSLEAAKIYIPNGFPRLFVNLVSGDVLFDNLNLERSCRFNTLSGNVRGAHLHAKEVKVTTKSGDISLKGIICENLILETFSGDVNMISHSCRRAHLKSKSGDIRISEGLGDLKELTVDNISGDIFVDRAPAMSKLTSISGDIRFSSREKKGIDWSLRSVSGDIVLETADIRSRLFFSTISGEMRFLNVKPGYSAKNEYVLGTGEDGKIALQTVSGDARLQFMETDPSQSVKEEPIASAEGDSERKAYAKRFVQPDENVQKVVQMNSQGILSKEEAVDLLHSMGYKEEEIALFLEKEEQQEGE
ncbi:MAG TPA: DUF4097 family beta strand repeat-containing protein [Thermotogota bacterium]|nr:DUF4097 domain-containing protein [Thermotogaceae bacterium]HNW46575.1 DUF4097 family beta strand repeat-containing protein [Thermotogota bacterium]HOX64996.1 DUF4097 family beta strand repeat-containing protein [Thermotogota bacterium]HPG97514.1 DUF4097 family beta strand repeat-containing protein [Thermotogota bacterium]HPN28060.1 DUF4097 family beta strand repeat-containing protein [Thermotogota bacterium]